MNDEKPRLSCLRKGKIKVCKVSSNTFTINVNRHQMEVELNKNVTLTQDGLILDKETTQKFLEIEELSSDGIKTINKLIKKFMKS